MSLALFVRVPWLYLTTPSEVDHHCPVVSSACFCRFPQAGVTSKAAMHLQGLDRQSTREDEDVALEFLFWQTTCLTNLGT